MNKKFYCVGDFYSDPNNQMVMSAVSPLSPTASPFTIVTAQDMQDAVDFKYGDRWALLRETDPDTAMIQFKRMWDSFCRHRAAHYASVLDTLSRKYNPIENYDRHEEHTGTDTTTRTPDLTDTETQTPTDWIKTNVQTPNNWKKEDTHSASNDYKETQTEKPTNWLSTDTHSASNDYKETDKEVPTNWSVKTEFGQSNNYAETVEETPNITNETTHEASQDYAKSNTLSVGNDGYHEKSEVYGEAVNGEGYKEVETQKPGEDGWHEVTSTENKDGEQDSNIVTVSNKIYGFDSSSGVNQNQTTTSTKQNVDVARTGEFETEKTRAGKLVTDNITTGEKINTETMVGTLTDTESETGTRTTEKTFTGTRYEDTATTGTYAHEKTLAGEIIDEHEQTGTYAHEKTFAGSLSDVSEQKGTYTTTDEQSGTYETATVHSGDETIELEHGEVIDVHGNIGVLSNQQMQMQTMELAKQAASFIDTVIADFFNEYTVYLD